MNLNINSISLDSTVSEEEFKELDTEAQFDIFNKLLAKQLSLYLAKQKTKPSFEHANFKDTYKLLKIFNARMVELGLVHGNLFELVMDDYKSDFNLLLENRYLCNEPNLQKANSFEQLNNEHLFYREAEFIYRTNMIDRYALADFVDLVIYQHIGLVPNMVPFTALKIMFELEFIDGSIHLAPNRNLTQLDNYPVESDKNSNVIEKYKSWARFNVGKMAFIMPYPQKINLTPEKVAISHFRKDCPQFKRYAELVGNLREDWTLLKNNNEITVCRVLVDILSSRVSEYLKNNIGSLDVSTLNDQFKPFIQERKLRFKNANLPAFVLQEFFEWGDLNANFRWLLRAEDNNVNASLTHIERIDLIETIESNEFNYEQVLKKFRQLLE